MAARVSVNGDATRSERARILLQGLQPGLTRRIRVVLAEDQAIVRQAVSLLLEYHEELEVVGTAGNGREAVEAAERFEPDVVLMDLAMPAMNGIEATRLIRKRVPNCRVLLLTAHADHQQLVEALRAGVSGCVVKRSDVAELVLAIQTVSRGNPYFSEALADGRSPMDFIMEATNGRHSDEDPLTAREREVLQLIAEGHQNQTIADELFISVKTVEAHKAHIKAKLRASSDMDLLRHAIRRGIVGLHDRPELDQ
jgi:DNA-binding NarL/FixJ family response regulator